MEMSFQDFRLMATPVEIQTMLKDTESHRYLVPVLMHTLDVLELLLRRGVPLKMYEISEAAGVPLTTTYRILRTLAHRGYLAQDIEGRFSLLNRSKLKSDLLLNTMVASTMIETDLTGSMWSESSTASFEH
jgi:hypothetical protein